MRQIKLEIGIEDACILRDALTDNAIDLRTFGDNLMSESVFLSNPTISERRKARYQTLRDYAEILREFCAKS